MYDIGENTAALEEAANKHKAKKQERKQKRAQSFQKIESISRLIRSVKKKKAKLKKEGKLSAQEMRFTGNMTDIAGMDGMKCSDLKKHMPDKETYEAAKRNVISAQNEGYISIDENNVIHLTDKGRELIQSEGFVNQFEQDQLNTGLEQIQKEMPEQRLGYVELSGTSQDMGAFQYADHIDFNSIENSPLKQQVISNFRELEKKGYVNIDNETVYPTDKGFEFAQKQDFRLKPASGEEMKTVFGGDIDADGVPNKIDNDYSYLGRSSVKASGNAAQTSAKAGQASAKTAAKTAATGAKSAAASAGGTAATAGTATAAGAATAGVGAVVVVAADAMKKAVNKIKDTIKQTMQSVNDGMSKN